MGEKEFDITKQRSLLNWAQIMGLSIAIIGATWTTSKIHSRFEILEGENKALKEQIDGDRKTDRDRVEYVNQRIDKKFNQLKDSYHSK